MSIRTSIHFKTGTAGKSKKMKLRDVLSADMISPPLGDFCHRSHIGRSGESDTFGDMSFLQGQHDLLSSLSASKDLEGGGPPKPPRLHLKESQNLARNVSVDPMTAIIKTTSNQSSADSTTLHHNPSGCSLEELPDIQKTNENQQQTEDLNEQQCPTETMVYESSVDSMFSFKIDLGPSILEDILKVMDNYTS
ncbi:cdc42 effector protein 2-like [Stegostoma tigrinum]|uniref:cdc42 effector protein 2-like n=1 Tax=Stegostoma tigrinum TaxID=3053191 RepID=UPI00202B78C7|nr:cdc42 effector protein 2-like [Stegostoma tigrinum]XP_048394401.1 cdc42 effector protein 2-like [Stegostoma tigrinum]